LNFHTYICIVPRGTSEPAGNKTGGYPWGATWGMTVGNKYVS